MKKHGAWPGPLRLARVNSSPFPPSRRMHCIYLHRLQEFTTRPYWSTSPRRPTPGSPYDRCSVPACSELPPAWDSRWCGGPVHHSTNSPLLLHTQTFTVIPGIIVKRHTHTHTRLTALCPGQLGRAGNRKVKPIWNLLKQETVSGGGTSWAVCKSAPRSWQITMPAPHHSVSFTGRMLFLTPNQQCQSTEGKYYCIITVQFIRHLVRTTTLHH